MNLLKRSAKNIFGLFGLEIQRKLPNQACSLQWIEEARKHGMDVNDFIEKDHGKQPLQELEKTLFKYIRGDSLVCELGAGTGCYSRYIISKIPNGKLYIVDVDPFSVEFLEGYLDAKADVRLTEGQSLPFADDAWLDCGFCASTFTGLNLTFFAIYMKEFNRVLKPGGYFVFDYFDVATEAGWKVLQDNVAKSNRVLAYNFHATETVDKVVSASGFEIVDRYDTVRGSVFVTARKVAQN